MKRDATAVYALASFALLALAVALRFYNIGGTSLWFDEAVYARLPIADFFTFIEDTRNRNSSPILLPLAYFLVGETDSALLVRLLPALFSASAVLLVLLLSQAGVDKVVALLSGFILAVAPIQIQYAQEVREYSLSVFVAAAVIFAQARLLYNNNPRGLIIYCVVLFLAPLASYASVFVAAASLSAYVVILLARRTARIAALLTPSVFLLLGCVLTYLLTAKYQFGVAKAPYLADHYPDQGLFPAASWLLPALQEYLGQGLGVRSHALGLIAVIVFAAGFSLSFSLWRGCAFGDRLAKSQFCIAVLVLAVGSIVAAFMDLYPFGGIRQHLASVPLIALCFSQSVVVIARRLNGGRSAKAILFIAPLVLLLFFLPRYPDAYAEIEDVQTVVSLGTEDVRDESVYIYYAAVPAVKFHFGERGFVAGSGLRGRVELMANEILEVWGGCDVTVVFSHIYKGEDREVIEHLRKLGLAVVRDVKATGARAVTLRICP
jgi:hypothetical protein